jgi:hydrogenase maturation protease
MSDTVERIADALLYEGYLLYPYRRSAVKNRQRFNFGVLYPEEHVAAAEPGSADRCFMQTECLVSGSDATTLALKLRFLQLVESASAANGAAPWQEAVERTVRLDYSLGELLTETRRDVFAFLSGADDAAAVAAGSLNGEVELSAGFSDRGTIRLRVRIINRTSFPAAEASRHDVLKRSLVSCHAILALSGGQFVSLLDPPDEFSAAVASCENIGAWPVLVGEAGQRDTLLASPIILYDYPTIAPESAGDLFDATEIDEILSLRIMTLTEEEKREVRQTDERARRLLDRTESLTAEQLMQMHGVLRQPHLFEDRP